MASLGNTGANAIVSAAAAASNTLTSYEDKLQAYQWENSAMTDDDYANYASYLQDRINKLQATGTIANASKALTLASTLRSTYRSYTSNVIQRAGNDVLTGSGSNYDKLNTIGSLYSQAVSNGDDNLAQNLLTQYYSLDQTIQYEEQTAATAAQTLADKNATAQAAGYKSAASGIQSVMTEVGDVIQKGGLGSITKNLKQYADKLRAAGADIPAGTSANVGSILYAGFSNMYDLYLNAANAVKNTDPDKAASYIDEANKIKDGVTTINIGGRSMNAQEVNSWAQNPNSMYTYTTKDANGLPITKIGNRAITGYAYDKSGNLKAIYNNENGNTPSSEIVSNENLLGGVGSNATAASTQKLLEGIGLTTDINAKTGNVSGVVSSAPQAQLIRDMSSQLGIDVKGSANNWDIYQQNGGYMFVSRELSSNTNAPASFFLSQDQNGHYAAYNITYDPVTGSAKYNLAETSDKNYDIAQDTSDAAQQYVGKIGSNPDIQSYLKSVGMNNSTNPSALAAITNLYNKFKIQAQQAANQTMTQYIPTAPTNTVAAQVQRQSLSPVVATQSPLPTQSTQAAMAKSNAYQGSTANMGAVNKTLSDLFANFQMRPSGWTEKVILPTIAKQFYGGNIKAASNAVYTYRKANYGS